MRLHPIDAYVLEYFSCPGFELSQFESWHCRLLKVLSSFLMIPILNIISWANNWIFSFGEAICLMNMSLPSSPNILFDTALMTFSNNPLRIVIWYFFFFWKEMIVFFIASIILFSFLWLYKHFLISEIEENWKYATKIGLVWVWFASIA